MAAPAGINVLNEIAPVPGDYGLGIGSAIVAGAANDTNIAVTGILKGAEIIMCAEFLTAASIATVADRTADCSATSDGNIQITAGTSTATSSLMVVFRNLT